MPQQLLNSKNHKVKLGEPQDVTVQSLVSHFELFGAQGEGQGAYQVSRKTNLAEREGAPTTSHCPPEADFWKPEPSAHALISLCLPRAFAISTSQIQVTEKFTVENLFSNDFTMGGLHACPHHTVRHKMLHQQASLKTKKSASSKRNHPNLESPVSVAQTAAILSERVDIQVRLFMYGWSYSGVRLQIWVCLICVIFDLLKRGCANNLPSAPNN